VIIPCITGDWVAFLFPSGSFKVIIMMIIIIAIVAIVIIRE
jgi:hypothetical protein